MLKPINEFKKYAAYYEYFYQDKDYLKESKYLERIFKKYGYKKVEKILDLGCGIGDHSLLLAKKGYNLTGIDLSKKLINVARKKTSREKAKIKFIAKDARNLNLKKEFDAVISMFNVMGFQARDADFRGMVKTASNNLKKGGIFVFDCWFAPAVLSQKPDNLMKTVEKGKERIIKFTKATLNSKNKTVNLQYKVFRISKKKILDEFEEEYNLRFFFPGELKKFLEEGGFKILEITPFLKLGKKPDINDWNIAVISRKI